MHMLYKRQQYKQKILQTCSKWIDFCDERLIDSSSLSIKSSLYYFNKPYEYKENVNTRNIKIEYGEYEQNIDLSNYVRNIIENNEKYNEYDSYIKNNTIIELDDSKTIYITDLSFEYNRKYELEYLSIEGYLLEK